MSQETDVCPALGARVRACRGLAWEWPGWVGLSRGRRGRGRAAGPAGDGGWRSAVARGRPRRGRGSSGGLDLGTFPMRWSGTYSCTRPVVARRW